VTKREWQIEMANRFAKRDKAEELINAQNTIRQLEEKLECYKRLVDANNMASNPISIKSRVMLREVREMKTIMTKDEALKIALEALENAEYSDYGNKELNEAITAIKEALAQPEQEPVAWMNDSTPSGIFARHREGAKNFGCTIPLYTAPPQRKG